MGCCSWHIPSAPPSQVTPLPRVPVASSAHSPALAAAASHHRSHRDAGTQGWQRLCSPPLVEPEPPAALPFPGHGANVPPSLAKPFLLFHAGTNKPWGNQAGVGSR